MSFTSEFKKEILSKSFSTNNEKLAFISAVVTASGSLQVSEKGYYIEVMCEMPELAASLNDALFDIYGGNYEVSIKTLPNNMKTFTLRIGGDIFERVSGDIGYVKFNNGKVVSMPHGISCKINNLNESKAYITGMVAVLATVTVPQQNADNSYSGGYHFEMLFDKEQLAYDIMALLAESDIFVKKVARAEQYGLYIKDSEMISDIMAFCGANNAVLELNNIIGIKELRNNVNRAQNCNMANMDKTINAGQKQLQAIRKIADTIGLNALPEKLRIIADIRLNDPSLTLEEIAESLDENIGKSGINHRFRKIIEIADGIEEE